MPRVTALAAVDGVEVTVVAPAGQQSGTGGNATDRPLTSSPQKLLSGFDATAVDGFPADAIRVAFRDLGLVVVDEEHAERLRLPVYGFPELRHCDPLRETESLDCL